MSKKDSSSAKSSESSSSSSSSGITLAAAVARERLQVARKSAQVVCPGRNVNLPPTVEAPSECGSDTSDGGSRVWRDEG